MLLISAIILSTAESTNKGNKYSDDYHINGSIDYSQPKTTRGLGISAWGLVVLIVSMILLGVAAYYMALFYPILCRKERKYDRIELADV